MHLVDGVVVGGEVGDGFEDAITIPLETFSVAPETAADCRIKNFLEGLRAY